jgi:hypothetical protein
MWSVIVRRNNWPKTLISIKHELIDCVWSEIIFCCLWHLLKFNLSYKSIVSNVFIYFLSYNKLIFIWCFVINNFHGFLLFRFQPIFFHFFISFAFCLNFHLNLINFIPCCIHQTPFSNRVLSKLLCCYEFIKPSVFF